MQRLLSFGTIGVIGWLAYLFLQGGGLQQMGDPHGANQSPYANPHTQYRSPGNWNGTTAPSAGPNQTASYQGASSVPAIMPSPTTQMNPPGLPGSGPTIRIASFNIQTFGNTKLGQQHIILRLADIIRKFDIVAIQEIRSQNDYLIPNFVQMVNSPGAGLPNRRYDFVIGPRLGRSRSTEQYVYIFDSERIEVDRQSVYTINDPDDLLHREPLVATFATRGVRPDEAFTFTLVNIHVDPGEVPEELDALADVYRVVRRSARQEDDVILLGDFNTDDRHLFRLGQVPGIFPTIAGVWTNTLQNAQYDNLIIHQQSTTEYTGRSGVFDVMRNYNLTPQQASALSDHFPVWAEFSIYERDYQGRVARRNFDWH